MIFDSHAHYDDEAFDIDREDVINSLKEQGVVGVLNCGASLEGSYNTLELSKKYDFFYGAVGIHPEFANILNNEVLKEIENMTYFYKIKAIGEIGLDYYYEDGPERSIQRETFRLQMGLAQKLNLPVVLHIRDAYKDALEIMQEFKGIRGVVHCFSGSVEFAKDCLKLGYYIGFTGVITFKNAKKILEVAEIVPIDKILIETDCPYMAPVPYRGKRNYSPYLKNVVQILSQIKGIEPEELEEYTKRNIENLLNI